MIANSSWSNGKEAKKKKGEMHWISLCYLLGWWFVCDNEDNQGWAPATYLEPVSAANEEENDEWVMMGESDSHGMAPYRYVCI